MIMRAVKRNARAPDFEGLDSFLSTATDSTGGVVSLEFDKRIADLQNDAMIMKQNRMLKEEHEAAAKKKGGAKGSAQNA